jgi:biotin-(acetyl-CoA carboxylase) ligase
VDFQSFVAELSERRPPPAGLGAAGGAAAGGPGSGGGAPGAAPGTGSGGYDNLVVLSHTVSTNLVARGVAVDLEAEGLDLPPLLVVAFEQSGGRGRQGRSWSSPRGRGVYATVARAYAEPELLPALPLLVGVGLCTALSPHVPGGCGLKWPNDLVVPATPPAGGDGPMAAGGAGGAGIAGAAGNAGDAHGAHSAGGAHNAADAHGAGGTPNAGAVPGRWRKIGGILIEALVHPGNGCVALIGIGVNHSHRREDLPEGATSLLLETADPANPANVGDAASTAAAAAGRAGTISLAGLTWELVAGVERELAHAGDLAYAVAAYRRLSIHRPGERMVCRIGDQEVAGTFGGFDESGRLRLVRPAAAGGELIVSAGEVIER